MKAVAFTCAILGFFVAAVSVTLARESLERAERAETAAAVLGERVANQATVIDDQLTLMEELSRELNVTVDMVGHVVRNQEALVRLFDRHRQRALASYAP